MFFSRERQASVIARARFRSRLNFDRSEIRIA